MKKLAAFISFILISTFFGACTPKNIDKSNTTSEISSKQKSPNSKEKDKTEYIKDNKDADNAKKEDINLKLGSKGEGVKMLQQKLNKFGYKLKEDGEFGKSTDFAVKNFQSKVKVTVDGIVGEETLKLLDSTPAKAPYIYVENNEKDESETAATSDSKIEAFINSKNCPSSTNYFIYTNLSQHKVYVFTGENHKWKLQKSAICTVGKKSTPTIKGHFAVGSKGTSFTTEYGAVAKYFTQISGNYLFHSILYDRKGNVMDGRLGMNLSHGCIRLSLENAKYIYDNVPTLSGIWIE